VDVNILLLDVRQAFAHTLDFSRKVPLHLVVLDSDLVTRRHGEGDADLVRDLDIVSRQGVKDR